MSAWISERHSFSDVISAGSMALIHGQRSGAKRQRPADFTPHPFGDIFAKLRGNVVVEGLDMGHAVFFGGFFLTTGRRRSRIGGSQVSPSDVDVKRFYLFVPFWVLLQSFLLL